MKSNRILFCSKPETTFLISKANEILFAVVARPNEVGLESHRPLYNNCPHYQERISYTCDSFSLLPAGGHISNQS